MNLEYVESEIKELKPGEVFLLKDLFKGYEWNRKSKQERIRLGVLFLNTIETKKELEVVAIGKTASNQQQYKKIVNIKQKGSLEN